jgi:hypothetical protein
MFKILFAITAIVSAGTQFTRLEVFRSLDMINDERSRVHMDPVTINWDLTKTLQKFVYLGGADWGYQETYPDPWPEVHGHYTNFHFLQRNQTFLDLASGYPGLKALVTRKDVFLDVAHDTFKDFKGSNRALRVLKMRIDQRSCYSAKKCSKTEYTNYMSCSVNPVVDKNKIERPCQWFFWYYPRIIHSRLEQIAFVKLQRRGRFVPKDKPDQNNAWLLVFVVRNHTFSDVV